MSFWQEFKQFAVKGNMIDLAVGIIIGTAFNKIVSSLVSNIITPPLGYLTSGVDIANLSYTMADKTIDPITGAVLRPAVEIGYGAFLQSSIDFFIIALTVFVVIKVLAKLKFQEEVKEEKKPAAPAADIVLLTEIRDALVKKPSAVSKPVVKKAAVTPKAKPVAKAAAKPATKTVKAAKPAAKKTAPKTADKAKKK